MKPQVELVIAPNLNWLGTVDFIKKFDSVQGINATSELMIANQFFGESFLKHVSLSFTITCSRKVLHALYDAQRFRIWQKTVDDEVYVLASGSIQNWIDQCALMRDDWPTDVRVLYDKVFLILESKLFETVKMYHKIACDDGTFTLKKRFG
jgi:hypothetical protein